MEGTIRPSIRLTLEKEERFFGPGVADLLELVEEKGSIQGACSEMGMSYSKSWKIIKRAERELGYPLLSSHNGGTAGGTVSYTHLADRVRSCGRSLLFSGSDPDEHA